MSIKGKILVVDDDDTTSKFIKIVLEEEGYFVHSAASGANALFILNEIQPDLILLDLWMPGMNGFEVCKILKEDEQTKAIPIIFLSATTNTSEKVKGFQLGAVDFITKPFDQTELFARVQNHMQINQMRLQLEKQAKKLAEFNSHLEEEVLRRKQAEERYDAFINADLDMIFVKDEHFRYLVVNDAMAKFFGKTKEEMLGKTDLELNDINIVFPCQSSDRKAMESKSAFLVEELLGTRFCETTKFPLQLSGNKKGIGGIIRDITEKKQANENLSKFKMGIDSSVDAIFISNLDGTIEYVNASFEKIYGYARSETIGQTPRILKSGLLSNEAYEHFWNTLLDKKPIVGELKNKAKNGQIIEVEASNNPILNENDEIIGFISINRDITEKKQVEQALKESEQRLDLFFSQSLDGFFFMMFDHPIDWNDKADKDQLLEYTFTHLKITRINDAMLEQYGAKHEQFLGLPLNKFYKHNIEQGKNIIRELFDLGRLHVETDELKLNGEQIIIEGDYTCIYDSDQRIIGLFGIQRDITQTKLQSEALLLSENKYRNLFKNNPAPMWISDIETLRFLEVNDTAIAQYGYSREEFLQMTLKDIRPINDTEEMLKDLTYTTRPFNKHGVWRHIKKNGEIIFVEISSHQIEFEQRPARMVLINNVTELKLIEEALVESENSLKQAQTIANMGDWEFDVTKNKLKCSENFYRLFDLKPSEIEPTFDYFKSRIHPDDIHLIDEGYNTLLQTKSSVQVELRITFPDNRIQWMLNKIIPSFNENQLVLLKGVNIDITERKKADEQIVKLSTALEQSPLSIIITDTQGAIEYANPKLTQITGYTFEELKGQNPSLFKSGEKTTEEYKELWDTISSGKDWHGEFHDRKKNGELYWESATISPIFSKKGEIINFIAIKEDISGQKELMKELIIAKEKAEESDRLKSAFLANMSHEIRTPLNGILGFTELMVDPEFDQEQKNEMAKIILDNGDLLLTIVNDVLDISKIEAGQIVLHQTVFEVGKLISEIKNSFNVKAKKLGLELKIASNESAFKVKLNSDYIRLKQILTNLISNALKYTENGFVEIGCTQRETEVVFYVKDTGIGISERNMEKIFERFNREEAFTKKVAGNGLGLAIAKSFVEMLDGKIWVESENRIGSCFYFSIPT